MKDVDLNNLTTEAKESIKALFSLLAGDHEEVRLSIGGRHVYTISIVGEEEIPSGNRPDPAPSEAISPQTDPPIHGETPLGEKPTKVAHG